MVNVVSGYIWKMVLIRFIGRADVGHGNKNSQLLCANGHVFSKRDKGRKAEILLFLNMYIWAVNVHHKRNAFV